MKRRVRSLITMSLVAGSLMLYSCGDNKKNNEEETSEVHMEMNESSPEMETEEIANAEFTSDTIKIAFDDYLAIKDALVQTDAKAAGEAAKELQAYLETSNPELAGIAGKIVAAEDVNKQREVFSELTAAMDPVIKEAISSGKVYKQFCPMAFEGKGDYWYSTSKEIRNPYFGDKMLKCGRVDETIE